MSQQSEKLFSFTKPPEGKGSSDVIRKRLDKLKAELKINGKGLVFHGFRKFLNNFIFQLEVPFEARCQYMAMSSTM